MSRLFYLHADLLSGDLAQPGERVTSFHNSIATNLNKDSPFLALSLDGEDFFKDPWFLPRQLPQEGSFTVSPAEAGFFSLIPEEQLNIEATIMNKLLTLWQIPTDPIELNACGRKMLVNSFHYKDDRNEHAFNAHRKANAYSCLSFIEGDYDFKDKLLRYRVRPLYLNDCSPM